MSVPLVPEFEMVTLNDHEWHNGCYFFLFP